MGKLKQILTASEKHPNVIMNPFASYTLDENGEKVWKTAGIDVDFLDTNFSDILPENVPSVAKSKIDEIKTRIDSNHDGSEGLKNLFDHLSAEGII